MNNHQIHLPREGLAMEGESPEFRRRQPSSVFRILCPADSTGGIIGKGGSIIRQLCEESGARIRVEDPVLGSADRVISVAGEGSQRALVRVFERILRLGEGEKDKEKEKEKEVVGCRLLAPSSQVGCVLGKGGRIVQKIRQETGAQIRVLSNDQLPACAAVGDELIHITGSFFAVRSALLAVSSCLLDNLKTEPTIFATTKPLVTTPRGSGPPALGDPYGQKSYLPSLHSPDYQSRAYSSNRGMDIVAPAHKMIPEEEVCFRILCSNEKVGSIIGKGGATIRTLQSETGALIKVSTSDSDEKIIVISARENADSKHSPAQDAVLRVYSKLTEAGIDKRSGVSARLLVPAQQIGCLLGKGGIIIAEMRRATGASIRIFSKEQVPKCAQPNDEVVQVTGAFHSVQDALINITSRIRETILTFKPYPGAGMTQYMSAPPEISPVLLGSRVEPVPLGGYPSTGLYRGSDRSIGFPDPVDQHIPLSHAMDHIGGADWVPFSYGSENSGHRPAFDPTSPRALAPQAVSSGDSRSVLDVGVTLDIKSETVGSGNQTAVVTSSAIKVVVPQHLLGFVYGEHGSNLAEIREVSGAKVVIYDPKDATTEGKVVISGPHDQVQTAQSLLHAFILCGQES